MRLTRDGGRGRGRALGDGDLRVLEGRRGQSVTRTGAAVRSRHRRSRPRTGCAHPRRGGCSGRAVDRRTAGRLTGSRPEGATWPNRMAASAEPPSMPGTQASTVARPTARPRRACGRDPEITTATVGVPVPATASSSSNWTPVRPRSTESRASPTVASSVSPDRSPRHTTATSAALADGDGGVEPRTVLVVMRQPGSCTSRTSAPRERAAQPRQRGDDVGEPGPGSECPDGPEEQRGASVAVGLRVPDPPSPDHCRRGSRGGPDSGSRPRGVADHRPPGR